MNLNKQKMESVSMRRNWFDFVKKIRAKLSRQRKANVSHREAMKEASILWPKEKEKLLRRQKREAKKRAKLQGNEKS